MMNVSITQRQGLYMKQSPQQVLLSTLLQLPVLSLEQKIKLELEQNPLLEEDLEMEEELDQEMEEELKLEDMEGKQEKEDDGEVEEEYNEDRDEVDWDTILNDENWMRFKKEIASGLDVKNEEFTERLSRCENYIFTFEEDLNEKNGKIESTFILGRYDNIVGFQDGLKIAELYPKSKAIILDHSSHNPQIEQKEDFNKSITQWLALF